MSTKKKLIAGVLILVAAILFSIFVVPKNRDIPAAAETTTAEETTTMAESTADETTTDWFGMDWTTALDNETTAATTAPTTHTTQHTTTKATPPRTTTAVPRPATTRPPSTTRAVSTTKPPVATTRRPTTARATTTAADTLITYGISYGKSIGLTYRPQLTQGGEAVQSATQQAVRTRLDQAKAAGAAQFNVWRQGGAVYIATGR